MIPNCYVYLWRNTYRVRSLIDGRILASCTTESAAEAVVRLMNL